MPPKTKLSVASSEPVSLDESSPDALKSHPGATDSAEPQKATVTDPEAEPPKGTESATPNKSETAKEPEHKDDANEDVPLDSKEIDLQEVPAESPQSKNLSDDEGPPRPARPASALSKMQADLHDAFPQVEEKYIKAFLVASEGRIDPAFNALLSLLDPNFKPDPIVPQLEPVHLRDPDAPTDDELLARQLQKEFNREERRRQAANRERHRKLASADSDNESPDEIDQLKEQFTQGFEEARSTLNGWVSGLTKKFSDIDGLNSNKKSSPKLFGALGGSSFNSSQEKRFNKFDEDPEILSLDFSKNVNLNDDKSPSLPKRPQKPQNERWQPLTSDVPVNPDAFLVTDLEEEDKK